MKPIDAKYEDSECPMQAPQAHSKEYAHGTTPREALYYCHRHSCYGDAPCTLVDYAVCSMLGLRDEQKPKDLDPGDHGDGIPKP